MPKDYKSRATPRSRKKQQPQQTVTWWKWLLIILLIALFVFFLLSLKDSNPTISKPKQATTPAVKAKKAPKKQVKTKKEPRYDFYTILPEAEIVVPEYEIKTRQREERVGKRKASKYVVQAGSFRQFSQADRLRAELAFVGIESKVEKASIGGTTWNRVKIGPYSSSSQIASIKKQLKKNGIDAIVIEIKK